MRDEQVVELKVEIERVEARLDQLLGALGSFEDQKSQAFDVSAIIPTTDSSVSDLRARQLLVAGLARKLDRKGGSLVPLSAFRAATNSLRSMSNAADQIDAEIVRIKSWGGLQSINYDSFLAMANNNTQIDLTPVFKTLFDNQESFLSSFKQFFKLSIQVSRPLTSVLPRMHLARSSHEQTRPGTHLKRL